jgi:hypothetical protein
LALNTKGEKLIDQSKRTTLLLLQKPSWQLRGEKIFMQKGRTASGGAFIWPRDKHLKKRENLSNLKMLLKNSILIP